MPEARHEFENRRLGKSAIEVLPIGIGTNKWGKGEPQALMETYRRVAAAGPAAIDTAEVYGSMKAIGKMSPRGIGACASRHDNSRRFPFARAAEPHQGARPHAVASRG